MNIQPDIARRPGRPKSEEKAEAIREAAGQLFMTIGMERTSMDAIAQSAGVSKQTVYSHFNSKDELFRDCVHSKIRDYGLVADSDDDADADIDQRLTRFGTQFLTLISDPEVVRMFRLMITEATSFPNVAQSFHESGPMATIGYLTTVIQPHLDDMSEATARQAAGEFATLLKGEFFLQMLLGTRTSLDEREIRQHVRHAVRQIRKLYELNNTPS